MLRYPTIWYYLLEARQVGKKDKWQILKAKRAKKEKERMKKLEEQASKGGDSKASAD